MKTFTLKETKHPDVFRVVDRDGNWENYFVKSKNAYLPGVTTILNRGYAKGAFFEQWLSQHTAEERDQILNAASEKGDKVHRAIDLILSAVNDFEHKYAPNKPVLLERETGIYNREIKDYEPISNDEWDALLAFASFWEAHEPIVLASEATLYSIAGGYAGTADAILILTKKCDVKACKCEELVGRIGLWDWKASSGIRPSYSAQVASYATAENIAEYLPPGTSIDYTAILRIGTNHKTTGGYEMKSFNREETQEAVFRFHSAKQIASFEHKPFNPDEDIQEIPDVIELTVKKFDFEAAKAETPKAETSPSTTKNGERKKGNGKARSSAKAPARHKAA